MYYGREMPERIKANVDSGRVITISELQHLASLVVEGKRPNGTYGDTECLAWEVLDNLRNNPEFFK